MRMQIGYPIALKFDRRLGSAATEPSAKFQNDLIISTHISRTNITRYCICNTATMGEEQRPEFEQKISTCFALEGELPSGHRT